MLEEEITLADFKKHRIKIEAERAGLQNIVDALKQRQHLIKADFEVALQLATELDFLFEKENVDEKRLLCETVFKRVYRKEGKVSEIELNAPFGLIASKTKGSGTVLKWLGKKDSNLRLRIQSQLYSFPISITSPPPVNINAPANFRASSLVIAILFPFYRLRQRCLPPSASLSRSGMIAVGGELC